MDWRYVKFGFITEAMSHWSVCHGGTGNYCKQQLSFISLKNYLLFYLQNLKVTLKRARIQSHLVSSI